MKEFLKRHIFSVFTVGCFLFRMGMLSAQTTFYVSSLTGNDSNNGASPATAWKTVDRVNQSIHLLTPGSSALFERGGIYYGSMDAKNISGTAGQPITFGAYGEGEKPVISGAKQITGWTKTGENLWKAYVPDRPGRMDVLFINGQKFYPARFPNHGYRTVTNRFPNGLQDNTLNFPDGYWNGATVAYKVTDYYILRNTAARSYADGRIEMTERTNTEFPNPGWGYFIQNHINAIDTIGEWVYDQQDGMLTLCTRENPNEQLVEYMYKKCAIDINKSFSQNRDCYFIIENLCFQHYQEFAISGIYGQHLTIRNNVFRNGMTALYITGFDDCRIIENTVTDMEINGMTVGNNQHSNIHKNTIRRIGVSLDGGQNGGGTCYGIMMGIVINSVMSNNNEITMNHIDSIGYCGISFGFAQNLLVKNNVVNHTMLSLSDGGAIYTMDRNAQKLNNKIIDNIVLNSIGNSAGTPYQRVQTRIGLSPGIYLDDDVANLVVDGNTVSNCGAGIFFHGSTGNQVHGNVLYNNTYFNILAAETDKHSFTNNDLQKNYIHGTCLPTPEYALYGIGIPNLIYSMSDVNISTAQLAANNVIDNNYISAPFTSYFASLIPAAAFSDRTTWTRLTNFDVHSRAEPVPYALSGAESPDEFAVLVYNPTPKDTVIQLNHTYMSFDSIVYAGSIHLQPFKSAILFRCEYAGETPDEPPVGESNICIGASYVYSIPETPDLTGVDTVVWQIRPSAEYIITPVSGTKGSSITVEWLPNDQPLTVQLIYHIWMNDGSIRVSKPLTVNINRNGEHPPAPIGPDKIYPNLPVGTYQAASAGIQYEWTVSPPHVAEVQNPADETVSVSWSTSYTGEAAVSYRVRNECGWTEMSDPLAVQIYPSDSLEDIPGIFTPNGDGFNDTWNIPEIQQYPEAAIRIYNRAKKLMVELKGAQMPWDGRDRKGNLLESGYYLYQIELQKGGRVISGYVTILR